MCYVDKQLRKHDLKKDCRYVLTVHDEVVYEVRPHRLQEVVRLLDEWMTYPWKLPKAHGRNWVVPLLTEPGIDINWKARYDYFKMVDGTPVESKFLDEDGNYIGKLKKSEYFHKGRIYQAIPDFLIPHIKRADEFTLVNKEPPDAGDETTPESDSNLTVDVGPPPSDRISSQRSGAELAEPQLGVKNDISKFKDYEKPDVEISVFRFVFRAPMNELNLRKLHAISILAEGTVALRLVANTGSIIISEKQGVMVNPEEFTVLSKMFGLS